MKLTSRIVLLFILFATLLLMIVGMLAFHSGSESLKAATVSEMLAVAIEKESSLDSWINERTGDLDQLAHSTGLQQRVGVLATVAPESPAAKDAHDQIVTELLPNVGGPRAGYLELFIIEPGGKVIASTDPNQEGKSKVGHVYFENSKSDSFLQLPYLSTDLLAPAMTAATPLRTSQGNVIGTLVARLDFEAFNAITARRTGLRQTDDAFLINADRYFITQPRFMSEPVTLRRKVETEAARRCLAGNSGVVFAPDYRGVPVIAVYRWDAKRQIGLIEKIDQAEALAPVRAFGKQVLVISVLVLFATAGLAFLLARTITQPLRELHQRVKHFAEGKTAARLPTSSGDEIGLLASEFNTMAEKVSAKEAQLRTTGDELTQVNESLRTAVHAHKHAELVAIASKVEAEKANLSKSEFLSRTSHELRTPMNAILGFAQLLDMEEDLGPDTRESVDQILKAGRHLLELINEVLDISHVESGRMTLSVEAVAVGELVQETARLLQPIAAARSVQVATCAAQDRDWHVLADRQRLKQVLLNLLSNAIKYNRTGGTVKIHCTEHAGETCHAPALRICVTDTGPGIDAEKLPRLFTPFDRLDAERTHVDVEGVGLGLALSKRLVELMSGAIGVETSAGPGSAFWVEFPVAESPLARLNPALSSQKSQLSELETPKTLVYIEDNFSNLKLIERLLAEWPGIKLLAAMQGVLGLDLIREQRPDLVLLDLNLPDMSGQEVLARLRRDPQTKAVPVIIISADASHGQRDRLLAAGANGFLTKPIDVREFLNVLDENLRGRTETLKIGATDEHGFRAVHPSRHPWESVFIRG